MGVYVQTKKMAIYAMEMFLILLWYSMWHWHNYFLQPGRAVLSLSFSDVYVIHSSSFSKMYSCCGRGIVKWYWSIKTTIFHSWKIS